LGYGRRSLSITGLLPRDFFDRPAPEVASALLGCVLEHETPDGRVAVVITEVEAYEGEADPASHAYRGMTGRTAVMYGPPGHAYVYFTYGMHFCVNVVCMPAGTASAVLLRAGRVIAGEDLARLRRAREVPARELARGPARLCRALAISRPQNGADLCDPGSPLRLGLAEGSQLADAVDPVSKAVSVGPRVGVSVGAETNWRFWLTGDETVSVYRAHKKSGLTRLEPVRQWVQTSI
jgi:DNA-3-methyladenine glycosylase